MFEKIKANIVFHQLMKRPDIMKAYTYISHGKFELIDKPKIGL